MELRKSEVKDVNEIMGIIGQAQQYLKEQGIDQWQNQYPNHGTIEEDIKNGNSYVLTEEGEILATAAIIFGNDKTYDMIWDGEWLSDFEYVVIHRIAVKAQCKGRGIASVVFHSVEKMCIERGIKSIRVDTHKQNLSMQKLLTKNGFQYCGIIHLEDGAERVAFEKIIG